MDTQAIIRLMICDDQDIVRDGLEMILNAAPDFAVVAMARDGQEAIEKVAIYQPDVVLMDLKMPRLNGVQAIRTICKEYPQTQILVLTTYEDEQWVTEAVRAGAHGYLLKDTRPAELFAAIRSVAQGKSPLDGTVAATIMRNFAKQTVPVNQTLSEQFNEREILVLQLIAKGLSNAEIGEQVFLSEGTVRNLISTLLGKLEVNDRTQAIVSAIRHGLINVNEL